ncbi:MAG TPA: crotonase/enoyl-CoA hydratase family protein [Rhodobiaceae bacterium]|jgi:enoyl-CoA hydratase|nr:crotonase/enoyl-CoA hydratase family protein [Rhodobiaceae bacterium]
MSEFTKVEIEDGIATITLDDGKANALGFTMIEHINKALDEAEAAADVIVMTGREGVMTAGFDLKVMRNEPDRVMDLVTQGGQMLVRIFASPKPVLLASTGHGIAAGALLMLSGDYRISMAGDFKYGLNESAIGMVLPPYGMDLARFKLNQKFLDMAVVGADLYGPEMASQIGYTDEVAAADKFAARVREKAEYFKTLDAKAYAGNKRHIRQALADKMAADLKASSGEAVAV